MCASGSNSGPFAVPQRAIGSRQVGLDKTPSLTKKTCLSPQACWTWHACTVHAARKDCCSLSCVPGKTSALPAGKQRCCTNTDSIAVSTRRDAWQSGVLAVLSMNIGFVSPGAYRRIDSSRWQATDNER